MMKLSSGHLAELAKLSQVWAWPGEAPWNIWTILTNWEYKEDLVMEYLEDAGFDTSLVQPYYRDG